MIEERGRVLSVEADAVWVETMRQSTCGSCQARAGCGSALLQKVGIGNRLGFIRVSTDRSLQVGDQVTIGVPEQAVVMSSLLMYLLPLVLMFAAGLLLQEAGLGEPLVILGAFSGLIAGFAVARAWAGRRGSKALLQPLVLTGPLPDGPQTVELNSCRD
ncbi:SoxR reducing system RseC family protein [Halopseudomonas salegens]|uniref:Positive regulator of sigma(E), RseC/MucC n=1 Tax=Halopseudomonas salegens TaxID=1434072 RepID=A0A1H2EEK5_9GAMM|nr:SoxR reducing system RseC family protein [Halopseudomonas salegens]SDT93464.1 positive regulator of sigma(E), RseC/MucC [Halopseudomonas salegens]